MTGPNPKRRRTILAVTTAVLIATPLAVVASHRFTDVPDSNIFHGDIHWLAEADVTRGCNPPANDEFCPKDNVTREQMAAFMHRLATNRVVDAATAEEADHAAAADEAGHAATADHATTAGDADTLDGEDSSTFVKKGEESVVSSDMIDDEAGVALAANDSGDVASGISPIVSVAITAPTDGFVLANANLQLILDHTNGTTTQATVGLSTSLSAFTQAHQDNAVGVPSTAPTGLYLHSPGLTSVFSVTAGEVTIYLLGEENSGAVSFNDATLSAMFVPTSYGEVVASGSVEQGEDPAG